MCGFYCIAFIGYMLGGNVLLDYIDFFSPNNYKKDDKINISILKTNMIEEANLEFRLTKNDEKRNYLLDEIKNKYLLSEKYKKACKYLNYVEHMLILASTITGCVSVSAFASSVDIPVAITSSAVGINICAITAGIKKHKSMIKKKKKKHDKIVLLGKDK